MENNRIQQEILLVTNSMLSKIYFSERKECRQGNLLSVFVQLEEASWNGWLQGFLPGVLKTLPDGKGPMIWLIQQARSFLHIDLCEQRVFEGKENSVDPYFFLSYYNYN